MLDIKKLIPAFIDVVLFDNYYHTSFSLELEEEILLKEEYIYPETELILLLELVNCLAFLKGEDSKISTLYLINKLANTIIFHRKTKKIYSDNLSLGKLDINYVIKEFSKKGSFEYLNSFRLNSFYSDYEILENILFVGIIYEVYKKIEKTKHNLLIRNPKLKNLILVKKIKKSLLFLKNVLSKPIIKELLINYLNNYKNKGILSIQMLNTLISSNKVRKLYKFIFKTYLNFIEKEKFFDIEKINKFKLYEYFIIKSLFVYLNNKGIIKCKRPLYKKDKILEGYLDNVNFEIFFQSSSPLEKNPVLKYDLNLIEINQTNKKQLYAIPDILLKIDNKFVFIDAKYKSEFDLREDIYQMIGYTQIFNLEEYNFILVYPFKEKIFGGDKQTKVYEFYTNNKSVKIIVTCLDSVENSSILFTKILSDFLKV